MFEWAVAVAQGYRPLLRREFESRFSWEEKKLTKNRLGKGKF